MVAFDSSKRELIEEAFGAGVIVEDKYRVKRTIGRGAMGLVLLGEDVVLSRPVALKAVLPAEAGFDSEEFRDLLRREAAVMAQIRHDNVAQVYAFGEHEGFAFFAMEYVPGENLRSFMRRSDGPIPLEVTASLMGQVCSGLDAVHRQGIVHRDIKPENVIIGPRYRVCLVDFGISASEPREGRICGTSHYLAPEYFAGPLPPPERQYLGDVYAAGLCAYELLTGELPYDLASGLPEVYRAKLELDPPPPRALRPELPAALDPVMRRALDRDPAQRYQTALELKQALTAALQNPRSVHQGPRILVVDDDPAVRTLYVAVLEARFPDAEVVDASDGLIAYEVAKSRRPDLMIVDINMPRVDGRELCRALKATPSLARTPVVVISGESDVDDPDAMAALGAREAIRKPVSGRQLARVIERHLPASAT